MFLWHLTEMLLPYLEERANTFVSSIKQHYCPLVLQEVELALFPFLEMANLQRLCAENKLAVSLAATANMR